jgi:hypothetical protein
MSEIAFGTICELQAAFEIILRIIVGFLQAATSSSKRVIARIYRISERFLKRKQKLYINFSPQKGNQNIRNHQGSYRKY